MFNETATEWYLNDKRHRENGPAIEYADGSNEWYLNGRLHRKDGPAIERACGAKFWLWNGKHHRVDGPAVEHADGSNEWYLNGVKLTQEDHAQRTQPVIEIDVEKLVSRLLKIIK